MASIVVNRGLQVIGGRASNTADAFNAIQVMSVDDRAVAFVAGDTTLGTPTNEFDDAFDVTPTRSGQVISHLMTLATGEGNFGAGNPIRRIALHNDVAGSVSGTSTTLVAGVDGQSLQKTSDFTLAITLKLTYTSV